MGTPNISSIRSGLSSTTCELAGSADYLTATQRQMEGDGSLELPDASFSCIGVDCEFQAFLVKADLVVA